jgi:hypothetical protein
MPNGQSQIWGEILVLKLEPAGLKKVNIKAHTTSQLYGARLCIITSGQVSDTWYLAGMETLRLTICQVQYSTYFLAKPDIGFFTDIGPDMVAILQKISEYMDVTTKKPRYRSRYVCNIAIYRYGVLPISGVFPDIRQYVQVYTSMYCYVHNSPMTSAIFLPFFCTCTRRNVHWHVLPAGA